MQQSTCAIWLSLLLGTARLSEIFASKGIPGTTQTISGYDTEMGSDAICWKSLSAKEGLSMASPLIKNFNVSIDGVKLLQACPIGNNMSGSAPDEHVIHGERLRTGFDYTYRVSLDINMTSLRALAGFTSDRGPGLVAVQVLNCVAGISGFCSPFIHEEADARLAALAASAAGATASDSPKSDTPIALAPTIRGFLHGDSHVHSGYVDVYLDPEKGPVYQNVKIDVPMIVNVPGDYFSIASAQMYFFEESVEGQEPLLWRYDMSNAIMGKERLISYQVPAEILEVDQGAKCFVLALVAASSLVLAFLLVQTIKHRDHQVMKLSQASFLIVFLAAALVATVSSFLMEPKNNTYCRISTSLCVTSLQILYAVTVGRLWRIHTLINPLLLKTMGHQTWWWTRFIDYLQNNVCIRWGKNSRKMRLQVTEWHLAALVVILTIPQVAIQVLGIILQPRSRTISYDENESIGRAICASDEDLEVGETIIYYGYFLFCLLVVALLSKAIQSRKLPSLFNESKTIFDSALTSFCIMVMGVAIILVTREPTTSPTVSYLVWVFIILSISVNTSLRIVLPKLRMVWRGETVIVSQLVMDHTQKIRKRSMHASQKSTGGTTNSIADITNNSGGRGLLYGEDSLFKNSSTASVGKATAGSSKSDTLEITSAMEQPQKAPSETEIDESESPTPPKLKKTVSLIAPPDKGGSSNSIGKPKKKKGTALEADKAAKKKETVIEADKAPSRLLLLKMVNFQEHLNRVTQKIMSGVAVSHSDWEQTRRLARKFGTTFMQDVKFAWEEEHEEDSEHDPSTDVLFVDVEEGSATPLHGDFEEEAKPPSLKTMGNDESIVTPHLAAREIPLNGRGGEGEEVGWKDEFVVQEEDKLTGTLVTI